MHPNSDECPVQAIVEGRDAAGSLDITLASIAFDLSVDELQGLEYFTLDSGGADASVGRFETKREADRVSPQLAGRLSALSMSSSFGASNEGGGSQVNAASFHELASVVQDLLRNERRTNKRLRVLKANSVT